MTALAAVFAAGAITLAACGTDNNSSSQTTSAATTSAATSAESSAATSAASSVESSAATSAESPASSAASSADTAASSAGAGTGIPTFDAAGFTCATGTLRSSGSTAQGNVMAAWITAYNAKCNASINDYGGGGSGKGVSDFIANQTDFGGSDSAMNADQLADAKSKRCNNNDAIDLPMVTGPIAVAYNLSGVDKLVLTPAVLSDIFGGKVTKWNDPAIAALNSGVNLPDLAISTIHRSEDSGTTDNFTKYLTAAGGWTYPGGKSWTAPGGTGAQGSDGVASAVQSTTGAIGYVEWSFAQQDKLSMAQIDNGGGAVELTADSAGKAVAAAKVSGTGSDLALTLDYATKVPGAYPVILVTYELVCSAGNADTAALLKSFLGWAATDGQATLVSIGSAPLPAEIDAKVLDAIKALS